MTDEAVLTKEIAERVLVDKTGCLILGRFAASEDAVTEILEKQEGPLCLERLASLSDAAVFAATLKSQDERVDEMFSSALQADLYDWGCAPPPGSGWPINPGSLTSTGTGIQRVSTGGIGKGKPDA